MKKLFLIVLGIMSLVSCGKSEEVSLNKTKIPTEIKEQVTIEFWHCFTGKNEKALKEVTQKFNRENENIIVDLKSQDSYKQLSQKLNKAIELKKFPTLSLLDNSKINKYKKSNLIENLTPYIEHYKEGIEKEVLEDIPSFILKDSLISKEYYSLPFNRETYLLFYNDDILKSQNIKPPVSWSDLSNLCKKLTLKNSNKDIKGIAFSKDRPSSLDILVKGLESNKEAKGFLINTIENNYGILDYENNIIEEFSNGNIAMALLSTDSIFEIQSACIEKELNYKVKALPNVNVDSSLFEGNNITIFNKKTPEEKLAAFRYIKFLLSEEAQLDLVLNSEYLPLRGSVVNLERFKFYVSTECKAKGEAIKQFENGYSNFNLESKENLYKEILKDLK